MPTYAAHRLLNVSTGAGAGVQATRYGNNTIGLDVGMVPEQLILQADSGPKEEKDERMNHY